MTDILVIAIIICSFISLLYLIFIMPRVLRHSGIDDFFERGSMFAHRGLHNNDVKENTLQAFQAAVERGYGIELDVRLSADSIPVVSADDSLKRVFGLDVSIGLTYGNELGDYGAPTLDEALALIDGRVPIIIEIKGDKNIDAVTTETASVLDKYDGPFCVQSFNPHVLMRLKRIRPDFIRGQRSTNFLREKTKGHSPLALFATQNLLTNFLTKPDFIACDIRYRESLSMYICRVLYGIKTAAWTIRSPDDLEAAAGFDMVIFEGIEPSGDNDRRIKLK